MEMRPNLRVTGRAEIAQHLHSARLDGDLVIHEVGGPHPQPVEEPSQAHQFTDVSDGHAVAARPPVVLLRVDRDNDNRLAAHGACALAAAGRSVIGTPALAGASNAAATAPARTAPPPAVGWPWP